jgi:hypothetical protein
MANRIYGFTDFIGEGTGALDKLPEVGGPALADKDMAFGCVGGLNYIYQFDATSVQAESVPDYIAPSTGSGRWVLQSAYSTSGVITTQIWNASVPLTISTDAITVTQTIHTIDTEASAASDDLVTINGGTDGQLIVIRAFHTDRSIVVLETGNILTAGIPITLDSTGKYLMLVYDGGLSKWLIAGGNAYQYTHPTGDGNLHVPANSTTNNGKILTAGASAGTYTWETAYVHPNHSGDVTSVGDGATTIANNAVTLAKLATQGADTILANATSGAAVPTAVTVAEQTLVGRITGGNIDDLSVSQVRTLLDVETTGMVSLNPAPSDHSYSGVVATLVAGENITSGQICYLKSDGFVWLAQANSVSTSGGSLVLLATGAVSASSEGVFLLKGFFQDVSVYNMTPCVPQYISATTAGAIVETPPGTETNVVRIVGYAKTSDIIYFDPDNCWLEI